MNELLVIRQKQLLKRSKGVDRRDGADRRDGSVEWFNVGEIRRIVLTAARAYAAYEEGKIKTFNIQTTDVFIKNPVGNNNNNNNTNDAKDVKDHDLEIKITDISGIRRCRVVGLLYSGPLEAYNQFESHDGKYDGTA